MSGFSISSYKDKKEEKRSVRKPLSALKKGSCRGGGRRLRNGSAPGATCAAQPVTLSKKGSKEEMGFPGGE